MPDDNDNTDAVPGAAEPAGASRFSGRREFQAALLGMFERAAKESWIEIVVSDPDFSDWPLGERAMIQLLNDWAGRGRRLVMLAGRYDQVINRHARFVDWRRTWDHIIECRQARSGDPAAIPSALWGQRAMLQRNDIDNCVGICSDNPERRLRLRQDLDEWLAESRPAFPASTTGL
jgi:hypothetical protein